MDPAESVTDRPAPRFDEAGDATRRTWLANERTWLAWVRTGLTCTAVALGVGKAVPDLAKAGHRWPYTVLGVGYRCSAPCSCCTASSAVARSTRRSAPDATRPRTPAPWRPSRHSPRCWAPAPWCC